MNKPWYEKAVESLITTSQKATGGTEVRKALEQRAQRSANQKTLTDLAASYVLLGATPLEALAKAEQEMKRVRDAEKRDMEGKP